MKRVLIVIILIVLIFFGYTLITNGFESDKLSLDIASYERIEKKSNELTKAVAEYDKKNEEEYKSATDSLDSSIKSYEISKGKYEDLIEELGAIEDKEENETILAISKRVYEIDFLLTTLGTYANREGVDATLNIIKGNNGLTGTGYTLCNLQFIVTGAYIDISDFIEDLEGDDKLEFEIRNFKMIESTSNTGEIAEFTVYNIPINSSTFIESTANNSDYSYIDSLELDNTSTTNTQGTTAN